MIPHKIHYCWFGQQPLPREAEECIASWRRAMPDWELCLWNEQNFDVESVAYTREAYAAGKYAFVSDYVRLKVLKDYGGLYLDTDVQVFKSLAPLTVHKAFASFEGSKHLPVGTCVLASEAGGEWVTAMLRLYDGLHFLQPDGTPDLTTNVQRLTSAMVAQGFQNNGQEQDFQDLHLFPVDWFSPRRTTGEYLRTGNTYCDHLALGSWAAKPQGWKQWIGRLVGQKATTFLIKIKRRFVR